MGNAFATRFAAIVMVVASLAACKPGKDDAPPPPSQSASATQCAPQLLEQRGLLELVNGCDVECSLGVWAQTLEAGDIAPCTEFVAPVTIFDDTFSGDLMFAVPEGVRVRFIGYHQTTEGIAMLFVALEHFKAVGVDDEGSWVFDCPDQAVFPLSPEAQDWRDTLARLLSSAGVEHAPTPSLKPVIELPQHPRCKASEGDSV